MGHLPSLSLFQEGVVTVAFLCLMHIKNNNAMTSPFNNINYFPWSHFHTQSANLYTFSFCALKLNWLNFVETPRLEIYSTMMFGILKSTRCIKISQEIEANIQR